jgi:hypothetical protein
MSVQVGDYVKFEVPDKILYGKVVRINPLDGGVSISAFDDSNDPFAWVYDQKYITVLTDEEAMLAKLRG